MSTHITDAARLPRVRPSTPSSHDSAERDRESAYSLLRYRFERSIFPTNVKTRDQVFEVSGDHVHVHELIGCASIGISTDGGKRYIPVREGDTVKRRFTKLKVRFLGDAQMPNATEPGLNSGAVEALFLVSWGEAIVRAPKRIGFHPGFPAVRMNATTTGVDILSAFTTTNAKMQNGATLKFGGQIVIKNLDAISPCYIYYGAAGDYATGGGSPRPTRDYAFELGPRETLILDCESRMVNVQRSLVNDGNVTASICAACEAGTVAINVLVSRWAVDADEAESVITASVPGIES
jgi:hypothetical protein